MNTKAFLGWVGVILGVALFFSFVFFIGYLIAENNKTYWAQPPCLITVKERPQWLETYTMRIEPNGSCSFTRREQ